MTFRGWPEEALDFYEGLEADNSKSYWMAHKAVYEQQVLAPMAELIDELAPEFGPGKIFRPYRDVRFSKDKSPYKTALAAVVADGFIQLSASGLAAGSGMHSMASDQVDRYRKAVADERTGRELTEVISALESRQIEVHGTEALKTVPRGYRADHPRADLLRYKGLIAWREWPVQPWLGTPQAKQHVTGFLVATRPLTDWLGSNVGPSRLEPAARR
jgi:uncharacterized protein (TIGR02453 family)